MDRKSEWDSEVGITIGIGTGQIRKLHVAGLVNMAIPTQQTSLAYGNPTFT